MLRPGDVLTLGPLSFKLPRPAISSISDNSEDVRIASWLSDGYTPAAAKGDTAVIDILSIPEAGDEPPLNGSPK